MHNKTRQEFDENSIFTDECDFFLDSFDEDVVAVIRQDLENCLSAAGNNSPESPIPKHQNPNDHSNISKNPGLSDPPEHRVSSTPIILNFGNKSPENPRQGNSRPILNHEEEEAIVVCEEQSKATKKTGRVRPPSQTYDHIIAERKRREQLSQRFVVLSTIVPGLKKMDKTSILGDAIIYLKQLQEKVKTLEEKATKQTMESVVLVKRSQIMAEDEGSSDEKSGTSDEQSLPEIEAGICNNQFLLRVHCEKQKGILVNLLSKVEKLNLVVVNTNVATFGSLALDITIITEMEKEFNLTTKEVVRTLRATLDPTA
ncbi:hypothetical protein DH2020_037705 [Rehmannia glutinosa]|uniref:BHLH domain-containing protein n=1 Tax=Rehmannia glutinosa TaxID=99300 RepID=A0ABR0V3F3_REHGL